MATAGNTLSASIESPGLLAEERERQILHGAIQCFSEMGFGVENCCFN